LRSTRNEEEAVLTCAAWAPRPASDRDGPSSLLVFARGSDKDDNNSDVLNEISVAEYDFDKDHLSATISAVNTEDGIPLRIAVHPKGGGVLCSFSNSFKLFDIQTVGSARLKASDSQLSPLQGIGMQNCITFDRDGLLLATGGKDGHVRVFQWPSLVLILDEPKAFKSIQDLDIRCPFFLLTLGRILQSFRE
jgi:prolactin regulatory element-binding protein